MYLSNNDRQDFAGRTRIAGNHAREVFLLRHPRDKPGASTRKKQ